MSVMETFVTRLFRQDGVDHIRIGTAAETQLGKVLSSDFRKRFYIPRVGDFLSPTCFANWLASGDEEARHDPRYRIKKTVRGYQRYVLFAKYHQLCSLRPTLVREKKELPFAVYKVHQSGVKEFDRWKDYPSIVKAMMEHIVDEERGPRTPYPFDPDLLEEIDSMIARIAEGGQKAPSRQEVVQPTQAVQSAEEVEEPIAAADNGDVSDPVEAAEEQPRDPEVAVAEGVDESQPAA